MKSGATHAVIAILLWGCFVLARSPKLPPTLDKSAVLSCIEDQVEYYNDLCAEARACDQYDVGYHDYCTDNRADQRGSDSLLIENHFEGVKCATESIITCLNIKD